MTNKTIQSFAEELALEFVLLDASEPDSLTDLLPILDRISEATGDIASKNIRNKMLQVHKILVETIQSKTGNDDERFEIIGETISEMKSILHVLEEKGEKEPEESLEKSPEASPSRENGEDAIEEDEFAKIEIIIENFSKLIGGYCPGEIIDLGTMLNLLDELADEAKTNKADKMVKVAGACKQYVENMTLEELENTRPVEQGLVLMRALLRHLKKGAEFIFDTDDILALLTAPAVIEDKAPEKIEAPAILEEITGEEESGNGKEEDLEPISNEVERISEEDMEILIDFVSEAEENLDTIEVNLIELEQDPTNKDIINEIFRPFHTIKGVSGFLALKKINKLAHTTENLLDSARSGEFIINDVATDAILASVDMLKILISRVKSGIEDGLKQQDRDIHVDTLRDRLQNLQISLIKGEKEPIGDILVNKGVVDRDSVDEALKIQFAQPDKKIGEILVADNKTTPKEIASALMDQKVTKKKIIAQVKVSTDKLDDLVDFAGELVIAQSMLRQKTAEDPSLSQSVVQLGQIVTNMQNIAMSMRMIPIKATFMKMIRLVRDLSHKSGKDVSLNMEGEDTEIDRNVVDALYEPMVHMIRNSVDHGIEKESLRLEQGKPAQGQIVLRAYHKGGHIIIEIEDDGKGLDKDRILEKAIGTGLITGEEQLTDAQIYDLIMQPGFSTAKEITDVSGRGVGMDVVKNGIEKFRGYLNINSTKGKGTIFTISLPLTLAIIDGMLVRVGEEKYVIPTTAIEKAFKPNKEDCFTVEMKGEMVKEKNNLIPVIRLNELYSKNTCNSDDRISIWDGLVVVVESKDEKRALLIDELLGKDEYVIKSLGSNLEDVQGITGGAILADGRVGLILDVHGIFSLVSKE